MIGAFSSRRPVLESDLAGRGQRRWPGYGPAAHDQGVRAVFAFPLQVGAARLGALDIHRDEPGSVLTEALRDAFTFAHVAVSILLDGQRPTWTVGHPWPLSPGWQDRRAGPA